MLTRVFPLLSAIFLCGASLIQAAERVAQESSVEALRMARESQAHWTLGRLTVRHKWFGSPRVRAELLVEGRVVARLRVDPATGGFLPRHERPPAGREVGDLEALRPAVEHALHRLEIGDWTWPTEQGRAWGVPLRYGDRVVGVLKVDVRQGLLARADDE